MNGPPPVCVATALGMPIPAGTERCCPFTKIVRCVWMWNSVCSLVWQLIPSMACPAVAGDVPARTGAFGIGTRSGPSAPAGGGVCSVPSVDSAT